MADLLLEVCAKAAQNEENTCEKTHDSLQAQRVCFEDLKKTDFQDYKEKHVFFCIILFPDFSSIFLCGFLLKTY